MQSRRAVVQNDFKTICCRAKAFESERDNCSARRERFVFGEFGNLAEMPAIS